MRKSIRFFRNALHIADLLPKLELIVIKKHQNSRERMKIEQSPYLLRLLIPKEIWNIRFRYDWWATGQKPFGWIQSCTRFDMKRNQGCKSVEPTLPI